MDAAPAADPAAVLPAGLRVVAIDGPAGAGKSTVARALARRLGLDYLDTGAMYRAVAFAALAGGVALDDAAAVAALAAAVDLRQAPDGTVVVDGVDATAAIRGPEVSKAVSTVAANPGVRSEMAQRQRSWAAERGGGVMEGRDIGTVVFPDAALKVYLDADPAVRAARRAAEAAPAGPSTGAPAVAEVAAAMAERDRIDSTRAHAPLTVADGALVVDTTHLSVEEIVDLVARHAHFPGRSTEGDA